MDQYSDQCLRLTTYSLTNIGPKDTYVWQIIQMESFLYLEMYTSIG